MSYSLDQEVPLHPMWVEELLLFYRAGHSHQFVLFFNIEDYIFDRIPSQGKIAHDQIRTMREYLHSLLFDEFGCHSIYTYSLFSDLQVNERLSGQRTSGPSTLLDTFRLLDSQLRQHHFTHVDSISAESRTPLAVIIENAEQFIPFHLEKGQGSVEQFQVLEAIQRWALDPLIRATGNIVILITRNVEQLPLSIRSHESGCRFIRIPFPDQYDREAFIRFQLECIPQQSRNHLFAQLDIRDFGKAIQDQIRNLACITQGMRLIDIENMGRRFVEEARRYHNGINIMKIDDVQRMRIEIIRAKSASLLEIIPLLGVLARLVYLGNLHTIWGKCAY